MTSPYVLGIDLGATNSVVGSFKHNKPYIIKGKNGNIVTPSFVSFDYSNKLEKTSTVGIYAKNIFDIGHIQGHVFFDAKRFIGQTFETVDQSLKSKYPFEIHSGRNQNIIFKIQLWNKMVITKTPEEISALILQELLSAAKNRLHHNFTPKAVITVPAYFTHAQRQATMSAADIAGIHVLGLLNEPTAALIHNIFNESEKYSSLQSKFFFVYKLDDTTFDISVMQVSSPQKLEIKTIDGDTDAFGEIDFVQKLMDKIIAKIKTQYKKDIFENKTNKACRLLRRQLRAKCTRIKETLSIEQDAVIDISLLVNDNNAPVMKITRQVFEDANVELFDKTMEMTRKCLDRIHLSPHQIDEVLLVGGSSRIPRISTMLEDFFGEDKICKTSNPDVAVALGAAIYAALLHDKPKTLMERFELVDDLLPVLQIKTYQTNKIENMTLSANEIDLSTTNSFHQSQPEIIMNQEGKYIHSPRVTPLLNGDIAKLTTDNSPPKLTTPVGDSRNDLQKAVCDGVKSKKVEKNGRKEVVREKGLHEVTTILASRRVPVEPSEEESKTELDDSEEWGDNETKLTTDDSPLVVPSSSPPPRVTPLLNGDIPKLTTDDSPLKQMSLMEDPRNDLLKTIRDGVKLNKMEKNEQKEVVREKKLHNVATILASKRVPVEPSEEENKTELDDSEEWGDNEAKLTTDDSPLKLATPVRDSPNDLQKAVCDGVKSKKVEKNGRKEVVREKGLHEVTTILASRRVPVEPSEEESKTDLDDSEEWGDNETKLTTDDSPLVVPSSSPPPRVTPLLNGDIPKLTTDDSPLKQMSLMEDPRNDLLKTIRDGVKLNKMEKNEQKEVVREKKLHNVATILASKRAPVEPSEEENKTELDDSEEWGDNEAKLTTDDSPLKLATPVRDSPNDLQKAVCDGVKSKEVEKNGRNEGSHDMTSTLARIRKACNNDSDTDLDDSEEWDENETKLTTDASPPKQMPLEAPSSSPPPRVTPLLNEDIPTLTTDDSPLKLTLKLKLVEDPRNDLLKAIRDGVKLKKMEKNEQKEVERGGLHDVANILRRGVPVQLSEKESKTDLDDSEEWGEEEMSG